MKKVLNWILVCSIFLNIIFITQEMKANNGITYVDEIYHTVNFAADAYEVDLLKDVTVERSDDFWKMKLGEIRRNKSDSAKLKNQILVEYDNGETLILEMVENFQHEFVIEDLHFME